MRADLLGQFRAVTANIVPTVTVTDCRDAKDDKYLGLALAASATTIVSSDSDLLVLHLWRGVRILCRPPTSQRLKAASDRWRTPHPA